MKILLQDIRTGWYVSSGGGWVPDLASALVFPGLSQAKDYCTLYKVGHGRIVALAGGGSRVGDKHDSMPHEHQQGQPLDHPSQPTSDTSLA